MRQKHNLGLVLNVTGLAGGATSSQSAQYSNVDWATRALILVRASQACEVIAYRSIGSVQGRGTVVATLTTASGSDWAEFGIQEGSSAMPLGEAVRFAVRNTSGSSGNFEVMVLLLG